MSARSLRTWERFVRGVPCFHLPYRVVRPAIRASVEIDSIKKLEPFFDFQRSVDLREPGAARAALEVWLESGEHEPLHNHDELRGKTALYNQDDCVSAFYLREWLEQRRLALEQLRGAPVPRPATGAPEVNAEISQLRERLNALTAQLVAGLPIEGRSPEQQAQWLVAHLLGWHWRESKSAYWDYAQCCAIVVGAPALLSPTCRTPRQLMQASELCAAVEFAGRPSHS